MDLLSDILSRMQMAGTLYFRTSFTSPWSIRVPSFENVARFHFAHQGRCLVRIDPDKPPVFLEQGDLLIIMRGAAHTLFCDPSTESPATHLDTVVEESGFTGTGALVYGEFGTHHETQLICGHFAFGKNAQHLLIDALPAHIHIKNYGAASGAWMENTLKIIGNEAGREQLGSDLIAMKLSEIIFAQALRSYLENEGKDAPVLAGFADPGIARALTEIHKEPGHPWALEGLAQIAGMSRTSFVSRFSESVTMPPLGYITHWRMQIARQELATSDTSIIDIAEKVGYQSEAAFSRVFKKHHMKAPATYRRSVQMAG
ncbi:MAG: AraC family transcriptional regulator [Halopseudomonas aestusnigri]